MHLLLFAVVDHDVWLVAAGYMDNQGEVFAVWGNLDLLGALDWRLDGDFICGG